MTKNIDTPGSLKSSIKPEEMEAMLKNAEKSFHVAINQNHVIQSGFSTTSHDPKPWYAEHRDQYVKNKLTNVYKTLAIREGHQKQHPYENTKKGS